LVTLFHEGRYKRRGHVFYGCVIFNKDALLTRARDANMDHRVLVTVLLPASLDYPRTFKCPRNELGNVGAGVGLSLEWSPGSPGWETTCRVRLPRSYGRVPEWPLTEEFFFSFWRTVDGVKNAQLVVLHLAVKEYLEAKGHL